MLRKMHGMNHQILSGHLIEVWYRSIHESDEF